VAADPTRRAVLAATAALPLLITGCKSVAALAAPPQPPPDVLLLRAAISAERLMVARYEAGIRVTRGRQGRLAPVLPPLLAQHREHLAQLRSRLIVPGAAAAAGPAPGPAAPRLPAAPDLAIAYLQGAEQEASARLLRQVLAAPPSLAQLLASISASEATHVPVLAGAAGGAGIVGQLNVPAAGPAGQAGPAAAPAAAPGRRPDSQADAALQAALQAEQAASYGYGVVGAHLSGHKRAVAAGDWVAHQRARDALEEMLRSRGAIPATAAVAYSLPIAVRTGREAASLAVLMEQAIAAAYLSLVALDDPALRELGAQRIQMSALQAARWRGSTVAFPGMPASGFAG
jgi:Domain of unknown function (DUF4439)